MGQRVSYLVTILHGDSLLRCAIKVAASLIPRDIAEYPLEPESRLFIWSLLPLHMREAGPIVHIEPLFDVCEIQIEGEIDASL